MNFNNRNFNPNIWNEPPPSNRPPFINNQQHNFFGNNNPFNRSNFHPHHPGNQSNVPFRTPPPFNEDRSNFRRYNNNQDFRNNNNQRERNFQK